MRNPAQEGRERIWPRIVAASTLAIYAATINLNREVYSRRAERYKIESERKDIPEERKIELEKGRWRWVHRPPTDELIPFRFTWHDYYKETSEVELPKTGYLEMFADN